MKQIIYELELLLLQPLTRASREQLNKLIADDFMEFGAAGEIYNKQDILASLPYENIRKFNIHDFDIKELSENIILALYKLEEERGSSLRSSIWKRASNGWHMVFHQGTGMFRVKTLVPGESDSN